MDNKQLLFQDEEGVEREDLLDSNEYIQEFHSTIINSHYSVYAVCGDWGTGKTCFVKMWESTLKNDGQTFVHIDAFRMDYETEPFIMLIKAFKEFMNKKGIDEAKNKEWLNKAKECFSAKNILKLVLNIVVDKTIGTEPLKEFFNNVYDTCFDTLSAEESLYDQLVCLLNDITSQFTAPVYIVIDELDRCRPDFALETLERIKHIFHVKNVKFILVYNEKVLMSMINHKYGDSIGARKYLTKFVQKEYIFDNKKSLYTWLCKETANDSRRFGNDFMPGVLNDTIAYTFLETRRLFNLSLRDIQRILTNLERYKENIQDIYFYVTLVAIEILKYINKQQFEDMVKYYTKNKSFASNVPDRGIFNIIFTSLAKGSVINPDEAFYMYGEVYLS
ncbi:MAG: KAP family NTPase [Treponema sp.]|jgi:tRNA A37 threonylcarbamoyladenosine biosynthesis protein TsaE|nr:KAP family NTPase [Treponema sp.]